MLLGRIESGISRTPGAPDAPDASVTTAAQPDAPKGPANQRALAVYDSVERIKHAEARIKEAAAADAELGAAQRAGKVRSTELFDKWSDDLVAAIRTEVAGLTSLVDMQGLSPEAQAGAQRVIKEGQRRLLQRIAALPEWDAVK